MRIEKINENQIRCILTKSDLEEHEVQLSELAFGTENAKELFRDMIAQASEEFGFEAEDIPLMIEAMPVSPEKIILIITKVENPDDLSDRVSKYTKPQDLLKDLINGIQDEDLQNLDFIDSDAQNLNNSLEVEDELPLELSQDEDSEAKAADEEAITASKEKADKEKNHINQLLEETKKFFEPGSKKTEANKKERKQKESKHKQTKDNSKRIFRFPSLAQAMDAVAKISPVYHGENTLYKDLDENFYYLSLKQEADDRKTFEQVCNLLSEFGLEIPYDYHTKAYFEEHFTKIIEKNAVCILSSFK